jgi:DMSO/TMAO reductase YedYZ molybdopterin-dependent catalytic subunit
VKCFDLRQLTQSINPSSDFFTFHQTETIEANIAMTIECSGNSGDRSIMNGLVSTAVWTGVGLAEILRDGGVRPEAREVVFFGMDNEQDKKWEAANAEFSSPHGWSIFVQDALAPTAP